MVNRFELSKEQQEAFKKIRGNKYGEGGSFFGMCMNQALTHNRSFEEMLKYNLDIQNQIDNTYEELMKEVKPSTVSYEKK
jgi:hypothetical protein